MNLHFARALLATFCLTLPLLEAADKPSESDNEAVYSQASAMLKQKESPEVYELAFGMMRIAADGGHTKAQSVVGYLLAGAPEEKKELPAAVRYLSQAAFAGDQAAAINLRKLYETRLAKYPDEKKAALQGLIAAADQGQIPAAAQLGALYYFGTTDLKADPATAATYLRKAADGGDLNSLNTLAVMSRDGTGIPKDDKARMTYLKMAAEGGHAKAQASLGIAYATGNGIPPDLISAYKWMRLSALQEEVTGKNALADFIRGLSREQVIEGNKRIANFLRSKGQNVTVEELNESIFNPPIEAAQPAPQAGESL